LESNRARASVDRSRRRRPCPAWNRTRRRWASGCFMPSRIALRQHLELRLLDPPRRTDPPGSADLPSSTCRRLGSPIFRRHWAASDPPGSTDLPSSTCRRLGSPIFRRHWAASDPPGSTDLPSSTCRRLGSPVFRRHWGPPFGQATKKGCAKVSVLGGKFGTGREKRRKYRLDRYADLRTQARR
jgi:hypothetical protein